MLISSDLALPSSITMFKTAAQPGSSPQNTASTSVFPWAPWVLAYCGLCGLGLWRLDTSAHSTCPGEMHGAGAGGGCGLRKAPVAPRAGQQNQQEVTQEISLRAKLGWETS